MKKSTLITIIIVVLVVVCCCIVLVGGGYFGYKYFQQNPFEPIQSTPQVQSFATPAAEEKNPNHQGSTDFVPEVISPDQLNTANEMLNELSNTIVPISNLYDLAGRLHNEKNIPLTVPAPLVPLEEGQMEEFWVTNTDSHESFKVTARLEYITPHVYFWVEDGVSFDKKALIKLTDTFENKIYPTDRDFFGSEWTPGVDNDPHLYILVAGNLGSSLAGYFSSSDEYTPQAHEYSNAHEMFLMNADTVGLAEEFTYGVLAHEFQHMIHWYTDLNEETWLNEGFSELAALLNNYDIGGFDYSYLANTDLQLTDWETGVGDNSPHYGASFLFVAYFLDRFGDNATKALVADPGNGMSGVDDVLKKIDAVDKKNGKPITSSDLFSDWVVANYLNDPSVGDGRFQYQRYASFSPTGWTEEVSSCPSGKLDRTVSQFGADYILITCEGDHTINFDGQKITSILENDPNTGEFAFWSNKGDELDMSLTREFDLTGHKGPITLKYNTWYDLEEDYDYAYLEVSEDGENWNIIQTPSGTAEDISGNSFGWGYNAQSSGWIEESVDLSGYAGKKIQIRFEYITDAAVNGEGLMVDDIRIPEINYSEGFENGNGGWEGAGFVRIHNSLPQMFRLNLIKFTSGGTEVTPIEIDSGNHIDLDLNLKSGESAVVTVSGVTSFTRQPAEYLIEIK